MDKKIIIAVIATAVIAGAAGYYGGIKFGGAKGVSFTAGQFGANGQRMMRNTNGIGGGANRGAGGGFISGEVASVDNSGFTVKLRDGSSKIVLLPGSAEVNKMVAGEKTDIQAGKTVMITGQVGADGSVVAQTVQIRPNMPAPDNASSQPKEADKLPPAR